MPNYCHSANSEGVANEAAPHRFSRSLESCAYSTTRVLVGSSPLALAADWVWLAQASPVVDFPAGTAPRRPGVRNPPRRPGVLLIKLSSPTTIFYLPNKSSPIIQIFLMTCQSSHFSARAMGVTIPSYETTVSKVGPCHLLNCLILLVGSCRLVW